MPSKKLTEEQVMAELVGEVDIDEEIRKESEIKSEELKTVKETPKSKKNNKKKENKKMKKININYKKIIETLKTVIIVALIAGVIGFALGVKYQERKSDQINQKIAEQIKNLK